VKILLGDFNAKQGREDIFKNHQLGMIFYTRTVVVMALE
jgi:hypothetical protein